MEAGGDETARPIRELNPNIPEWLKQIVMKLLSKSREDRFDSAEQVAELLEDCLAHVQHPTTTPLPPPVAELVKSFGTCSETNTVESLDDFRYKKPPKIKWLVGAAFGFSIIFGGVLIALEMNKGTLTIESDADDVPIRIMQGDDVLKELTVTKGTESVRIAAGKYVVEIDGEFDDLVVKNGSVSLSRRTTETVKVIREDVGVSAKASALHSDESVDESPKVDLNMVYDPARFIPSETAPGDIDVSYLKTIGDITARYNKMTRPLRKELFRQPIPDLTVGQMRAAMLVTAEDFARTGKGHVASTLKQSVKDNRLVDSLTFTGNIGANSSGSFRQIAPTFIWSNGPTGNLFVLSAAELRYSRDGWSSSTWGDIHPPITGMWNLISVKANDELLEQNAFDQWKLGNAPWSSLEIGEDTLLMSSDEPATYDLTLDHNSFPQKFRISHRDEDKFEGAFKGSGFGDNKTLVIAVAEAEKGSRKGVRHLKLHRHLRSLASTWSIRRNFGPRNRRRAYYLGDVATPDESQIVGTRKASADTPIQTTAIA